MQAYGCQVEKVDTDAIIASRSRNDPRVHGGRVEIFGREICRDFDSGLVDKVLAVTDAEAIEMAHRLAQEEGMFAGMSSGANVLASLRLAGELGPGKERDLHKPVIRANLASLWHALTLLGIDTSVRGSGKLFSG